MKMSNRIPTVFRIAILATLTFIATYAAAGHVTVHTTYYYFTQPAHAAPVGYCVRKTVAVGDAVKLKDGRQASIASLTGTTSQCSNPEFPIGATVGPAKPKGCEFATPFNPDAGIYLPDGWKMQQLSCATLSKKKDIFFHARNETIDAQLIMDDITRSRVTSIADYAKTLRDRQATSLDNAKSSEIEELKINDMPAWRFHVQGEVKSIHKEMVYIVTLLDHGNDIVLMNVYLPGGLYADHADELNGLALDIKTQGPAPDDLPQP